MNKKYIFLSILLGSILASCSSKGIPSCDDKDVIDLVKTLNTIGGSNSLFQNETNIIDAWQNVYNEVYATEDQNYKNKIAEVETRVRPQIEAITTETEKIVDKLNSSIHYGGYDNNDNYIESNYDKIKERISTIEEKARDDKAILEAEIRAVTQEYNTFVQDKIAYLKNNYESNGMIYMVYKKYFEPKNITKIVTTSTNKDFKTCECKAVVEYSVYEPHNVLYSAQREENGKVIVEIIKK